jgi:3-oxoadipate CoA-transferase, beta subunit
MNDKKLLGRTRAQTAWRIAQDIPEGSYVNLGIGAPELVANYVPTDREVIFHSENGILGMGPSPNDNEIDWELINAGKKPVTMLPGGALFDSAVSFGMIRGQHLDYCVLGAFQVSATGDLANWMTNQADAVPAVGGAMDLGAGARQVLVFTDHCTKKGAAKIVAECSYPLTTVGTVTSVYTDFAVLDITTDGIEVREIVAGISFEQLQDVTDAPLRLAPNCSTHEPPVLS